jgi:hypothetical protein
MVTTPTIGYEITARLGPRVPRIVVGGRSIADAAPAIETVDLHG